MDLAAEMAYAIYAGAAYVGGAAVSAAPYVVPVATVANVGAGIYTALNQPKGPDAPKQTDYAKEQEAAATAQAEALLRRRGMASTIMTSPMGAGGATTGKATLGA